MEDNVFILHKNLNDFIFFVNKRMKTRMVHINLKGETLYHFEVIDLEESRKRWAKSVGEGYVKVNPWELSKETANKITELTNRFMVEQEI